MYDHLSDPQINVAVHSFPNITLNVEYTFTPLENGVHLKEVMQIHTHALLAKFVISEATKAQTALLENLKNRLEGIQPTLAEKSIS